MLYHASKVREANVKLCKNAGRSFRARREKLSLLHFVEARCASASPCAFPSEFLAYPELCACLFASCGGSAFLPTVICSMASLKPLIPLDRPSSLPSQVSEFLLGGREGAPVDLGDTLVLVPTGGAGRSIRRDLAKVGVLSPRFCLPLEALLPVGAAVASRLEREVAWAELLDPAKRKSFAALVPEIVPLEAADDRLGVAARLCGVSDQLAEAGLDPTSERLPALFEDDAPRWAAMAKLYRLYLGALSKHGLRDPNDLRLEQARDPSVAPASKRIVVACVPDLPLVVQNFLECAAEKGITVEVLVWSPSGQAVHLDAWGRPYGIGADKVSLVDWWKTHLPHVADEIIVAANDPASEAALLLDRAAENVSAGYALFSAAPESTVALGAEIARRGEDAYLPEGRPLSHTEFAAILLGYDEFVRGRNLRVLRSLLQQPAFLAWFAAEGADKHFTADRALEACDLLIADKLCATLGAARSWLDHAEEPADERGRAERAQLRCFILTAEKILKPERAPDEFLKALAKNAGRVASGSVPARELAAIAEALGQFDESPLLSGLDPAWRDAALRADIARKRVFTPAPENAVEIQGWLEAPWSFAGLKIIAGCREGALPSGTHEGAFLPERARVALGLAGQDARFARDAYLLSCLLGSNSRVLLGTSRFRSQGEPNRPSRLLFACEDEELPKRARKLLRPSLPAKRAEQKHTWSLELPRPALRGTVEAIRVTAFKNYLQCPLRFYLQNVCGMDSFDAEAREISNRDFGTVVHKVLEEYGNDPATKDLVDPVKIAKALDAKLDEVSKWFYGAQVSPVVVVQLESMRARLRSFAPLQAQARAEGWEIIATERAVKKTDERQIKIGPLTLTGTMDRVEVNAARHTLRVLDYKTFGTSRTPAETHLAAKRDRSDVPSAACTYDGKDMFWKDLQLPLYRHMVPHIWPEHADKTIEVGYVLLPADADDTDIAMFPLSDDESASALACAEEIATLVARGVFWPPSDKADFDKFEDWFRWCEIDEVVAPEVRAALGGAA